MGVLFSCPVDDETAAVEDAAPVAEQAVLKASLGSGGRLRIEGSLSFKTREQQSLQVETKIPAVTSPRAAPAPMPRELLRTRFADAAAAAAPESPKHEAAAVTLQKVYKSFRTRRRLADCAVLVEQSWCAPLPPTKSETSPPPPPPLLIRRVWNSQVEAAGFRAAEEELGVLL